MSHRNRTAAPRTAATLLAALLLAAGCGVLRDEVAATVGPDEITVDEVAELARSPLAQGGQDGPFGKTLAGDRQRGALAILVQDRIFARELRRLGGRTTDADRQQADQQLAQIEQQQELPSDVRKLVSRLVANQAAVVRLSIEVPTSTIDDAAVAAYFEEHRGDFPAELICLEGLVAPPTAVAGLVDQIEGGTSFDAAIASQSDQVFPIEQSGSSTCVEPGSVTTEGLADLVERGPIGAVQQFETVGQTGEAVTLVLRVLSRAATTGTEPVLVQTIRQAIQQEAQTVQQDQLTSLLRRLVGRADVEIDPRYGRFDASEPTLVAAPPVPRTVGPTTTLPAGLGG